MQHTGMLAAELAEQLFIIAARILELGRRRDNADPGILAAANVDEAVEDFGIVQFFLSATDRDDIAAISTVF